eukprot:SAG25_NODE_496_length_7401_cov_8.698439_6_plen_53_part_00
MLPPDITCNSIRIRVMLTDEVLAVEGAQSAEGAGQPEGSREIVSHTCATACA